jgi:hypothetical protein
VGSQAAGQPPGTQGRTRICRRRTVPCAVCLSATRGAAR